MDEIPYEPNAFYIFNKGYYDLARLYRNQCIGPMYIIRVKVHLKYKIASGDDLLDEDYIVLFDQTRRLKGPLTKKKHPPEQRRIVYYVPELKRSFTFLTKDFSFKSKDIAMISKQRLQTELFFRWIKQYLHVLSFWRTSENAVRIQIYVAVFTYCLVVLSEHNCQLGRTTFNVLRVLSRVLTNKTLIRNLFKGYETIEKANDETVEPHFDFKY